MKSIPYRFLPGGAAGYKMTDLRKMVRFTEAAAPGKVILTANDHNPINPWTVFKNLKRGGQNFTAIRQAKKLLFDRRTHTASISGGGQDGPEGNRTHLDLAV